MLKHAVTRCNLMRAGRKFRGSKVFSFFPDIHDHNYSIPSGFIARLSGFSTVKCISTESDATIKDISLKKFFNSAKNLRDLIKKSKISVARDSYGFIENKILVKRYSLDLLHDIERYHTNLLLAILISSIEISNRCRCEALNSKLIEVLIAKSRSFKGDLCRCDGLQPSTFDISPFVDIRQIEYLKNNGVHLIYILGSLRYFKLNKITIESLDYLCDSLNANIPKYTIFQLVRLSDDLGKLYRSKKCDMFKMLLQRCVSEICDKIEQSKRQLTGRKFVTILKSLSGTENNESLLTKRLNNCILTVLLYERSVHSERSNVSDEVDNLYRKTKGYIHLLHTLLLTGLFDNANIVKVILENVMRFCIFYFTASSKIWRMSDKTATLSDYVIDPNTKELLYAKYANKVFRAPCGTKPSTTLSDSEKTEEQFLVVTAALSRLLKSGKVAFCRGLKRCEVYIRMLYPLIHKDLGVESQKFLNAVWLNKFEEPIVTPCPVDIEIVTALKKLGYDPHQIMLDNVFLVWCIDYKNKLFLEIYVRRQAINNIYENKAYGRPLELKLKYLSSLGWGGVTINREHWKSLPRASRIAFLKQKINDHSR